MRCKRHSHDYIMRCEVCLLEKMAVSSRSTGRTGGAEGMRRWDIVVLPDRTCVLCRDGKPVAELKACEEGLTDPVSIAEARFKFEEARTAIITALRLCADFTDDELWAFGPTFKTAIGKAVLARTVEEIAEREALKVEAG